MTATTTPQPRVLLVEDHEDTRVMYFNFLREHFDVLLASDAEHALQVMRTDPPALVITDLGLPGMDGFQLISLIRCDTQLQAIPIVCLSGFGGDDYVQRATHAGATRVLLKPCMPDLLIQVVTALLQQQSA